MNESKNEGGSKRERRQTTKINGKKESNNERECQKERKERRLSNQINRENENRNERERKKEKRNKIKTNPNQYT